MTESHRFRPMRLLERLARGATPSVIGYLFALLLLFSFGLFPARSVALERACVWEQERSTVELASRLARAECRAERLTLDVRRWYSPRDAGLVLAALGEEGRSIYAFSELLLDYAFPAVYAPLFVLVMAWLFARLPAPRGGGAFWLRVRRLAPWLPLIAGAADLVENTLIVAMAWRFDGAAPALARVAAPFTFVKRGLLEVALLLVLALGLWAVVGGLRTAPRRGIGRWVHSLGGFLGVLVRYLVLVRVPLLTGGFLLALGVLGRRSTSTIENLTLMETPGQLAVLLFLALQTGGVVGLTALVAWENAAARFGVLPRPLASWLAGPGVARTLWFVPLGWPLVATATFGSMAPPNGALRAGGAATGLAIGVVLGLAAAGGIELLRRAIPVGSAKGPGLLWLVLWPIAAVARPIAAVAGAAARALGGGYWDPATKRIVPGHVLAAVGGGLVLLLYSLGFFLLHPGKPNGLFEHYPTVAFVLVITVIVCISLAGVAFFLDHFRFPLLLGVVLWLAAMCAIGGLWGGGSSRHHAFDVALLPRGELPSPIAAATARLFPAGPAAASATAASATPPAAGTTLTVVTLGGGGIQAAAWAAEALAGLHQALGPEFTRSVVLLSAVSGGSAGGFFFLEGFDPETGLPSSASLEPMRQAAAASSLEATGWGLAYPDLLRASTFLRPSPTLDRGWAMERAWLRSAERMKRAIAAAGANTWSPAGEAVRLRDWARGARAGTLPGVVMNATFVEDAQQAWLTNLDLSVLDPPPAAIRIAAPGHRSSVAPRIEDPSLRHHYDFARDPAGNQQPLAGMALDLDAVTAARLSATFPWVTPVARARLPRLRLPAYHLADGGYFDNYGTVAALDWLVFVFDPERAPARPAAEQTQRARLRAAIEHILFVDVRAFPPPVDERPRDERGLAYASAAPVNTLLGVRTSTQARRGDLELELLKRVPSLDATLHHLVLQPPAVPGRRSPPLSWHLSASDKRQVCFDWMAQEREVEAVREWFPRAPWKWPTEGDCTRRLSWRR